MFGKKLHGTKIVRVTTKIVVTFTLFIFLSNLASNYVNLLLNRSELLNLMNELLIKDLKSVYTYCNNQYDIYMYDKKFDESMQSMENKGLNEIKNEKAVVLGIKRDGEIIFQSSKFDHYDRLDDSEALNFMNSNLKKEGKDKDEIYSGEGHLKFIFNNEKYFGMFKYNQKWDIFILRGEEENEFFSPSRNIFIQISVIIIFITLFSALIGVIVLRKLLKFINVITDSIMDMIESKGLSLINLKGASNDDITYMGVAFNTLSSIVGNLVEIFEKFVNQDVVSKAYQDREVKLEGSKKELTVLFSDIKSFTYMTETLGDDIIKLLNMHYDRAIREIINYDGTIGSIIGDAVLAVYGVEESTANKSYQAVLSGYKLHEVVDLLRIRMERIKMAIEEDKGKLSDYDLKIYKAVLLEIGVGIDGGTVFYGTIGSYVRMTNTVIGDNVNSASRLEGLTRIYKVPIVCSEYVKNDIEENVADHGIYFLELDRVTVKGKTKIQRVYWPILESSITKKIRENLTIFESALLLYYKGDWSESNKLLSKCSLIIADTFKERTKTKCPSNWNGVWQMTEK
ncbi:MAG: adenylate/guanylate cyclase domain-containing protein [Leptospirales bacterium]|nr:adenylate/guanylate cyclase domain-containing protein [Leptospirales bacterium]